MTDPTATNAAPATPTVTPLTGVRRGAHTGYIWLLLLFLVLGVVQIFLAGLGVFDMNGEVGASGETAFDPHRLNGYLMGGVALLILILAIVARAGREGIIQAVILVLFVNLIQGLLGAGGEDAAWLGGLHAVVGIALLGLASRMLAVGRATVASWAGAGTP